MKFIKRLIILTGEGKGTLAIEKNGTYLNAKFNAFGKDVGGGTLTLLVDGQKSFHKLSGQKESFNFSVSGDIEVVHSAVFCDGALMMYGTNEPTRMNPTQIDGLKPPRREYALALDKASQPLPDKIFSSRADSQTSLIGKDFGGKDFQGKDFVDSASFQGEDSLDRGREYADDAIAEINYYPPEFDTIIDQSNIQQNIPNMEYDTPPDTHSTAHQSQQKNKETSTMKDNEFDSMQLPSAKCTAYLYSLNKIYYNSQKAQNVQYTPQKTDSTLSPLPQNPHQNSINTNHISPHQNPQSYAQSLADTAQNSPQNSPQNYTQNSTQNQNKSTQKSATNQNKSTQKSALNQPKSTPQNSPKQAPTQTPIRTKTTLKTPPMPEYDDAFDQVASTLPEFAQKIDPIKEQIHIGAREGTFYERVGEDIEKIFVQNERDKELEGILPNSKWVRIEYNSTGKYYVMGLIGKEYLCYGIPADFSPTPPEELDGYCWWLPLDPKKPKAKGYWIMYQNLKTGDAVLPNE